MAYPRINYEMTEEDLQALLDACKPTPAMYLSGGTPMGGTPQENANAAWARLGAKMGFDHMTVQPISGKGHRFFTAVPSETAEARLERQARDEREARHAEREKLQAEIQKATERLAALDDADRAAQPIRQTHAA